MIQLDEKYFLKNNNVHGVELVFKEEREREKLSKDKKPTGEKEKYTYKDTWYYPNPLLALKKWIELTENARDLTELTNHYEKCSNVLVNIYEYFKNNNYKL